MDIYVKNAGKVNTILQVAKFFETHYPEEFKDWVEDSKRLRTVSRSGFHDSQGNYTYVSMKVPTILYLACQWVMPGFGKDSDDVALLTRTLQELDGHAPHKSRFGTAFMTPKGAADASPPSEAP